MSETPQADKALENQADGTSPAQADQSAAAKKDKPVKPNSVGITIFFRRCRNQNHLGSVPSLHAERPPPRRCFIVKRSRDIATGLHR
ncbi:MAG: hypothetical protein EBZ24_06525 [Synechococcaceae bacterium WB9_4xB_025]|nr:hypothetical protein [Synechococcaceae bacterium WB9_4xB_025]